MTDDHKTANVDAADDANGKKREIILVTGMFIILAVTIGIVVWQTEKIQSAGNKQETPSNYIKQVTWPKYLDNLLLYKDMTFHIQNGTKSILDGKLNWQSVESKLSDCSGQGGNDVCLEWTSETKLQIKSSKQTIPSLNTEILCHEFERQALKCTNQELTDCFNVSSAHWYGGYADKIQNWPFQKNSRKLSAYLVNDSYVGEIGGVVERYFFSSSGVGIFIDHNVPLYFSLNQPDEGLMCFTAKYEKYPYFNNGSTFPVLKYKVCQGENILDIHKKMSAMFIEKPSGIPDEKLFKYPIWSTWAQYHKDVNQSTVLEFASNILKYDFTHAQLEIDDDWTPAYGDMNFNTQKFPNATQMVRELNDLGFRVTVWVHPFFNVDSTSFTYAGVHSMLVRQFESLGPAMTPWWDGNLAGILDVSNRSAVEWFLNKLYYLKQTYNISSFKFDAGETSWLPHIYSNAEMTLNPVEMYPIKWVELAAEADNTFHQEVRVGYRTQKYPIFVRMMDKMSNWGHDNAFKTIIPCVFTYGLLGYPFVLPDMIGGNAYNNRPDPELYIRWLQLNTFLPSMQYSIVPWMYNETIINITQKFTKMHELHSDTFIKYAKIAKETGAPIIRPLWWIAPQDEVALTCEDEFLVGDDYLVAPVMEAGARSRDIYFPIGRWRNQFHNTSDIIEGPKWIFNISVDLDKLAFYKRETV
ncbi:myogenesis-regulating glycosidase-like [Mercenaria mercenaria]|uniref:myogenesis-regulating glycosidase-like n=1 Tax=Mercenaria mercenaria TaxID=6596 RepID=UPI00234F044F|nr:myogenesis-regulating glycosidase-like [Mercenaria mercenaria]